MNKNNLGKLTKSQLIEFILQSQKPVPTPRTKKPIPTPRKSVKQIVQDYEDNKPIPAPRTEKPIPAPRTKKPIPTPRTEKPIPEPRTEKPIPAPKTKIEQTVTALRGYTQSYEISIKNDEDPFIKMNNTRLATEKVINSQLNEMKGLKYVETLKVTFEKLIADETVYKTAYFNSSPKQIINQIEIADSLQLSKQQIFNKVAQWLSEGSGWLIKSVDSHFLNIVKYKPLNGSSYIQLPEPLNTKTGLINLKNKDNECFRWCHIRHLNPEKKDPQRIKKSDRVYISKIDYSEITFPVTIKQVNKIEKKKQH